MSLALETASSFVGEKGHPEGVDGEKTMLKALDAGIAKDQIDGVFTNESYLDYHVRHSMAFAEYFGIAATARMITSLPLGSGASSGLFIHHAAGAIRSGQCDTKSLVKVVPTLEGTIRVTG